MADQDQVPLKSKLNLETARITWRELQTYFAAGKVIRVSEDLDMLTVAEQLAADNTALFAKWLSDGQVATVGDEQALQWYESDAEVWALVIKPWVLVQADRT